MLDELLELFDRKKKHRPGDNESSRPQPVDSTRRRDDDDDDDDDRDYRQSHKPSKRRRFADLLEFE